MALETLKGVNLIDGFSVIDMDELRKECPEKFNESGAMDAVWFENEIRPNHFIYVRHDKNSLSFTIQNGPIGQAGVNGCQVSTLITAAKIMIEKLDKKFPCRENSLAIIALGEALFALERRTKDREERGVEGLSLL
jgi:hypothetical protein